MLHLLSYRCRFWKRKFLILGLLFAGIFIICIHVSTNPSSNPASIGSTILHGSNRKKLDQGELHEKESNEEGVKFLSEISSRQKMALTQEEILIFKRKNKGLFEVESNKANRKKASHFRFVPAETPAINMNENLEYVRGEAIQNPNYEQNPSNTNTSDETPYVPPHRIVHFDLKGAPPSIPYILDVLKLSKTLGATGILLEYEDMFPFKGKLSSISAENHYSKEDLLEILRVCKELNFLVIPLIQTFGHLEFVLKLKEFSHLRDVPEMPESICPCHSNTMGLIQELADQVSNFHKENDPNFKFLHIGCDEVYHLGECEACFEERNEGGRNKIFTNHVTRVANYVRKAHGVTPIIWDDMLRNFIASEMSPLAGIVEPMVWVYAEDVYRFVSFYIWDQLAQVFNTVWTASAFKGAHGPTLVVPNVKRHLENNINWLELMKAEEKKFKDGFRGIVLTGWQRYDHFAILCELLPAAIPSLAVNLLATSHGYFNASLSKIIFQTLQCSSSPAQTRRNSNDKFLSIDLKKDPFMFNTLSWCFFSGSSFFKTAQNYLSAKKEVTAYIKKTTEEQAWMTDFSLRRNYSTPFRIDEITADWNQVFYEVERLMKSAKYSLSNIYDEYTQAEWIEQNVYPLYLKMMDLKGRAATLRVRQTWPARPFKPLKILQKEFGVGLKTTSTNEIKYGGKSHSQKSLVGSVTFRPKRLVQQPDHYRHPPGY